MNPLQESLHFGRFAIECGVVTQDQLNWGLEQAMANSAQLVSDVLLEAGVLSVEDLERVLMAMADGDAAGPDTALIAGNGEASEGLAMVVPPPPAINSPPPADAVGGDAPLSPLDVPSPDVAPPDPIRDTGPLEALGLPDPSGPAVAAPIEPAPIATDELEPEAAAQTEAVQTEAIQAEAVPTAVVENVFQESGSAPMIDALQETQQMAALAVETKEPAVETASVTAPIVAAPADLMTLLETAASQRASDLHLHAGQPPRMRLGGEFVRVPGGPVASEATEALLATLLDEDQAQLLREKGQVDFAYTLPGVARLRSNAYRHRFGTDVVFRLVALQPPTLAELGLPESLSRFGEYHQGMVLITGPSGCGKSSTMAALVNGINHGRPDHVLTVEDPIEFLHESRQCNVNQRQTGKHTASFARALKAALREDPDVIAIGELRDLETIRLALTAAETGHLVLATMHTKDSIGTINRVIGSFPPEEQSQVRAMVSESLRAIVSQRLASKKDGSGRVPALEILISTTAVGNLIREQKTFQLPSILQSGASQGMCSMDASLVKLLKQGVIEREEALRLCENPASIT